MAYKGYGLRGSRLYTPSEQYSPVKPARPRPNDLVTISAHTLTITGTLIRNSAGLSFPFPPSLKPGLDGLDHHHLVTWSADGLHDGPLCLLGGMFKFLHPSHPCWQVKNCIAVNYGTFFGCELGGSGDSGLERPLNSRTKNHMASFLQIVQAYSLPVGRRRSVGGISYGGPRATWEFRVTPLLLGDAVTYGLCEP